MRLRHSEIERGRVELIILLERESDESEVRWQMKPGKGPAREEPERLTATTEGESPAPLQVTPVQLQGVGSFSDQEENTPWSELDKECFSLCRYNPS